jgi:hypothetical protein
VALSAAERGKSTLLNHPRRKLAITPKPQTTRHRIRHRDPPGRSSCSSTCPVASPKNLMGSAWCGGLPEPADADVGLWVVDAVAGSSTKRCRRASQAGPGHRRNARPRPRAG